MDNEKSFADRALVAVSLCSPASVQVILECLEAIAITVLHHITTESCNLLVLGAPSDVPRALAILNGMHTGNSVLEAHTPPVQALLFVGNLSLDLDPAAFRALFVPYGAVVRCWMMHDPATGLPQGYGFVEFATRAQAEAAKSALAAHVLLERAIRIDWVEGLGARMAADGLAALQSRTLFIDKLPRKLLSIANIVAACSKFAPVNFHRLALSHGNSRGFGFMDFNTAADAARVQLAMNNTQVDGVTLRLSFANPCKLGEHILGGPPPPSKRAAASDALSTPAVSQPAASVAPAVVQNENNAAFANRNVGTLRPAGPPPTTFGSVAQSVSVPYVGGLPFPLSLLSGPYAQPRFRQVGGGPFVNGPPLALTPQQHAQYRQHLQAQQQLQLQQPMPYVPPPGANLGQYGPHGPHQQQHQQQYQMQQMQQMQQQMQMQMQQQQQMQPQAPANVPKTATDSVEATLGRGTTAAPSQAVVASAGTVREVLAVLANKISPAKSPTKSPGKSRLATALTGTSSPPRLKYLQPRTMSPSYEGPERLFELPVQVTSPQTLFVKSIAGKAAVQQKSGIFSAPAGPAKQSRRRDSAGSECVSYLGQHMQGLTGLNFGF